MLSNPASVPPSHHRHPSSNAALTGMGTEASYAQDPHHHQSQAAIRRGLSLDQAMDLQGTVSTNSGYNHHQQQQIMREAQMQGPTRPGHQSPSSTLSYSFDKAGQFADLPDLMIDIEWPLDAVNGRGPSSGYQLAAPPMVNKVVSRDVSVMESQQYHMQTPKKQTVNTMYPMTPVTGTRHTHTPSFTPPMTVGSGATTGGDDVFGMMPTPDGTPMKRSSSHQEASSGARPLSSGSATPAAPHTAPMPCAATFGLAHVPTAALLDVGNLGLEMGRYDSSHYSPATNRTSPDMGSMRSSPDLVPTRLFGSEANGILHHHHQHSGQLAYPAAQPFPLVAIGPPVATDNGATTPTASPKKGARGSSPKKGPAAPLPANAIVTDTGISTDELDAFLQGPTPTDKHWRCLYIVDGAACTQAPMSRRENARAHIQTHLADRRYGCGVCGAAFVRPNDLKRHAHTHSPAREHRCAGCGRGFGRADALRRHRMRADGCARAGPGRPVTVKPREEKKRGRPPKVVPAETAERRAHKERVRREVLAKQQGQQEAQQLPPRERAASVVSVASLSQPDPDAIYVSSPVMQAVQPAVPQPVANAVLQNPKVLQNRLVQRPHQPQPVHGRAAPAYSPGMEMAFTPPASPEDLGLPLSPTPRAAPAPGALAAVPIPSFFANAPAHHPSPPPTRGGGGPCAPAQPLPLFYDLDPATSRAIEAAGGGAITARPYPAPGAGAPAAGHSPADPHAASSAGSSPPDLDRLSASPPDSGSLAWPAHAGAACDLGRFDDGLGPGAFGPKLADLLFPPASRHGIDDEGDDLFGLFGALPAGLMSSGKQRMEARISDDDFIGI